MSQQRKLAREIRAAQGQSPAVDIDGKQYVFRKLKRKKCHEVLYNLVAPFIRIVATLIESVALPIGELIRGETEFDFSKMFKSEKFNTDTLATLLDSLPFEQYWTLACNILNDVEINGTQMGVLDDNDYYDDKPLEMLKAILKGIEVNYPFLKALVRKKEHGSNGSSRGNQTQAKE